MLVLTAAAVLIGCGKREEAGRQPQQPQIDQHPPAGDKPQSSEQPPLDDQSQAKGGAGADEEPLLLDDEPLLLLDDGEEEFLPPAGPVADNSRCYVCHMSYMKEDLAVVHAEADIGCADCHGDCDEHIADESWAWGKNGTPPEIMYPRPKINPFCMDCHPKKKIGRLEHKRFFAGTAKEKYCTDCHGDHRLAERKCKWK